MRSTLACAAALSLLLHGCTPVAERPVPQEPSPAPVRPAEPAPSTESGVLPSEDETVAEPAPPEPDRTPPPAAPAPREEVRPVRPEAELVDDPPEPVPSVAASAPVLEPTVNLTGRIELVGGDALIEETIIYFLPEQAGSTSATEPDQTFEIATRDKALSPAVMAVPRGARVSFPNNDPILHNLFSVSPENGFDLGVYGPGEAPSVTFDRTGVVNIYCNVHHDMHAHVLVIDSPWRTRAASDGGFLIEGLPTGPGELHVWHRQSERWSQAVELPLSGPLQISLEVTKPLLPAHRDKTGQPYNRRGRDPYR